MGLVRARKYGILTRSSHRIAVEKWKIGHGK